MNKLQLYIYKSMRGFKSVRNINPSDTVQSHIRDVRAALGNLDYNPEEKNLFYLLSYLDEGCFFSILRTIPDQPGDHLATTIFVPNGLVISPDQLSEIVGSTSGIVSNPSVTAEDMAMLQELFSREYPEEESPAAMVASRGADFAVCYYGGSTGRQLDDLFDDRLYQTAFLPYAGVLFVDQSLGIPAKCDDVTGIALTQPVELTPPEGNADGFTPHIFHHVFDRPFLVSQGSEVEIVWRRGGFEEKVQTITVDSPDMELEAISGADCRKLISPATFYITGAPGKNRVNGAVITVNGLTINEPRHFTLSELKNAEVAITAPGFAPFRSTIDLASTTQALIQLQEHRKVYRFELPVKSTELGAPIHFEIHTKRELSDSPIEGYSLIDPIREGHSRTNHLEYTGAKGVLGRRGLLFIAGALVAGIALGWIAGAAFPGRKADKAVMADSTALVETVALPSPADKPAAKKEKPGAEKKAEAKNEEKQADSKPKESASATTPSVDKADDKAIEYLESNTTWTRDGMAKHPALAGLFDDMNHFRFDAIKSTWAQRLAASKRFEKVVYHATESTRKNFFKPTATYCKDGDNAIAVQTYLNTIDPAKPK